MWAKHPWLTLFFVGTLGLNSACQGTTAETNKPLPEFPLTLEGLEAFANKADFELIQQYSMYASKEVWEHNLIGMNEIYTYIGPVPIIRALTTYNRYGGLSYSYRGHLNEELTPFGGYMGWDTQGRLIHLALRGYEQIDFDIIPKHKHLQSIAFVTDPLKSNPDVDIELFKGLSQLSNLEVTRSRVKNFAAICTLPALKLYNGANTYPYSPIRFEGCNNELSAILLDRAKLDDLEIANLPSLKTLHLAHTNIEKLAIDGATLPKLEFINFSQARLPEDLSQVELPNTLLQLDFERSSGHNLNTLVLPENLKYINLRHSNFSDYSFLTTAKNLESLHLGESAFNQFELLAELPNLKHLVLDLTSLKNEHLPYLTKLESLELLSVSGTQITDISILKNLRQLSSLSLTGTIITDLDSIPYLPRLTFLALPDQSMQRNPPEGLPDHIQKMMDRSDYYDFYYSHGNQCFFTDACTIAPWLIKFMKERFPDHPSSN